MGYDDIMVKQRECCFILGVLWVRTKSGVSGGLVHPRGRARLFDAFIGLFPLLIYEDREVNGDVFARGHRHNGLIQPGWVVFTRPGDIYM